MNEYIMINSASPFESYVESFDITDDADDLELFTEMYNIYSELGEVVQESEFTDTLTGAGKDEHFAMKVLLFIPRLAKAIFQLIDKLIHKDEKIVEEIEEIAEETEGTPAPARKSRKPRAPRRKATVEVEDEDETPVSAEISKAPTGPVRIPIGPGWSEIESQVNAWKRTIPNFFSNISTIIERSSAYYTDTGKSIDAARKLFGVENSKYNYKVIDKTSKTVSITQVAKGLRGFIEEFKGMRSSLDHNLALFKNKNFETFKKPQQRQFITNVLPKVVADLDRQFTLLTKAVDRACMDIKTYLHTQGYDAKVADRIPMSTDKATVEYMI